MSTSEESSSGDESTAYEADVSANCCVKPYQFQSEATSEDEGDQDQNGDEEESGGRLDDLNLWDTIYY